MKKLFLIVTLALTFAACEQEQPKPSFACDLAKFGVTYLSSKLATRWDCSTTKIADFLFQPINDKLCNMREKSMLSSVCPLVIGTITDLGAVTITSKFSCNYDKVKADFYYIDNLCNELDK